MLDRTISKLIPKGRGADGRRRRNTDNKDPYNVETEAQRALWERPSFSIRTRISMGFLIWFVLSLGITIASLITLRRIQDKLYFMETATNYTFEIQQARRFEKNYFLYGANLKDATEHVQNALNILEKEQNKMVTVVGAKVASTMLLHVRRYDELLSQLTVLETKKAAGADVREDYKKIELEMREHGSEMVTVAEFFLTKERQSVNTMLTMAQRIPIVFLLVLFIALIYVANFTARQMLQPLNRLMEATRRIADGDFTPITPQRKYWDEFSELAMAMNHMMEQLDHRQELLVQAHKLKAVGTLTAGVAHELNNPINNIMLTSSMLIEDYRDLSDDERLDMANDMMDQAERARKIVRNLLDFAREGEIQTEALHINDLIDETIQLVSNQMKLANVKIICEYAQNLPPIHGDRQLFNQVFLNLFLNSIDAMPDGGALKVATRNSTDRDFIVAEFSDTGVGIPEHIIPSIFDPFFTTKPTGKGTGLGLSVSLGIIRKHGGDISVKSQVNKGTTFIILLPIAKIPAKVSTDQ